MQGKETEIPRYLREANEVVYEAWVKYPSLKPEVYKPIRSEYYPSIVFPNFIFDNLKIVVIALSSYKISEKIGWNPVVVMMASAFFAAGFPLIKGMIMNKFRRY